MLLHNYDQIQSNRIISGTRRLDSGYHSVENPILIVCYTNHALDQLLVLISKFIGLNEIVRIGGRSKEKSLDECNLQNLRKNSRVRLKTYYERREQLNNTIEFINNLLKELNNRSQVNYHKLFNFCEEDLWKGLFGRFSALEKKEHIFMNWLGLGDMEYNFDRKHFIDYVVDTIDDDDEKQIIPDQFFEPSKKVSTFKDNFKLEEAKHYEQNNFNQEEAEIINQQREIDDDSDKKELLWKMANDTIENDETEEKRVKESNQKVNKRKLARINRRRHIQIQNLNKYYEMTDQEVAGLTKLWGLNLIDRVRFYKYLLIIYYKELNEKLAKLKDTYERHVKEFLACKEEESYQLLKSKKVIGMTTTGAAKHHSLLKLIKPKIVIAEEAAEVFESHIITCITESCEQLILIGDNEQLCPTPNLYKLSKRYNLNVSLFERLVNNNIPRVRLNVQHRMRPEISFFMQHFYDDLIDNDSVKNFENIKGLTKNVFFINHSSKEEGDEESLSKSNIYEAKYLTRLCDYLLKQN